MNIPEAELLTGPERAAFRGDINGAVTDPEAGRRIRYLVRGARTVNLSTGTVTRSDTELLTAAVRREAERDQGDGIQLGDYWYMVPASTLAIDSVGAADQILDGTDTFAILRAERDPSGSVWRILTRRETGR